MRYTVWVSSHTAKRASKSGSTILGTNEVAEEGYTATETARAARRAALIQKTPETNTATGTTSTPVPSDDASEMAPMSGGDGTSPRRWMKKICAAIAVARIVGETT